MASWMATLSFAEQTFANVAAAQSLPRSSDRSGASGIKNCSKWLNTATFANAEESIDHPASY